MYYNRKVSETLLGELGPKGAFGYLANLARSQHLADLQLRGYPHDSRCWATLYVGLTKVIDVYERNGLFWFAGKIGVSDWNPEWEQKHPPEWFMDHQTTGKKYVRNAIGQVADRFTNEGAVQAMLCTRASNLFSVIDREAVIGFDDTADRTRRYADLQTPLAGACVPDAAKPWFKPKLFGGELDLLAVDDDGRLLVVEIKPGSATSGIAWAPLQVTFYARLFRAWSDEVPQSREILLKMLRQRVDLGLTRDPLRPLRSPLEIVPVVAIGGAPRSKDAIPRLQDVQHALLLAGVGDDKLEVWQVEESVSRTVLPTG